MYKNSVVDLGIASGLVSVCCEQLSEQCLVAYAPYGEDDNAVQIIHGSTYYKAGTSGTNLESKFIFYRQGVSCYIKSFWPGLMELTVRALNNTIA